MRIALPVSVREALAALAIASVSCGPVGGPGTPVSTAAAASRGSDELARLVSEARRGRAEARERLVLMLLEAGARSRHRAERVPAGEVPPEAESRQTRPDAPDACVPLGPDDGPTLARLASAAAEVWLSRASPHLDGMIERALLDAALLSPEPLVRAASARGLALIRLAGGPAPDGAAVERLLADPSPEVRARALGLLWGDPALPERAAASLSDPDERARETALSLLSLAGASAGGRLPRAPGLDGLAGILARPEESERLRVLAARALSLTGDPGASAPLAAAMLEGPPAVRRSAATGLGTLWRTLAGAPDGSQAGRALREFETGAAGPLVSALSDADECVRLAAFRLLASMRSESALGGMTLALGRARGEERAEMLRLLARMGAPAVPVLERAYREETDALARAAAGSALEELGLAPDDLAETREAALLETCRREGVFVRWPASTIGPAAAVAWRSELAPPLRPAGSGIELSHVRRREGADSILSVSYAPLREADDARGALCAIDWGRTRVRPFYARFAGRHHRIFANLSEGPGLFALDLDGTGRDTWGAGWFWRAGLNFVIGRHSGIELHAEARALVGADADGPRGVGSASAGLNFVLFR